MSEHRLEDVFPMADKVLFMQSSEIKYFGSPKEVSHEIILSKDAVYHISLVVRIYSCLENDIRQGAYRLM